MIYRNFKDTKLSALGFGCMRFPLKEDKDSPVDELATEEMIDFAIKSGVNYFDTAWGYLNGNSELIIGKILSKYPRESFYLATKFPGFPSENMRRVEEIFEKQLEKCRVDYFDFYLFHNVCENNIDGYLDENYGVFHYLMEQKEKGRIRHLGFSTHGSLATIRRFLDAYGKDMEFCQIQLNYLDWKLQNAKAKVALIQEYGLPVWVMEPIRGGRLAVLPEDCMAMLNAHRPGIKAPEWAFRFLQDIDGVTMILSGMSDMQQLTDNLATFQCEKPLNKAEMEALMEITDAMIQSNAVPCTACAYCTERCPQGLDIPGFIKAYNGGEKLKNIPNCVGCHNCEAVCPQGIMISEIMAKLQEK